MKKICLSAILLIANSLQAQIQEEQILADGSHVITIIPKIFTKEEIDKIKYRRIPSTQEVKKHPTLLFSNSCIEKLETNFEINAKVDSTLENTARKLFEEHVGISNESNEEEAVSYHQIWTLKNSTSHYYHEDLSESLVEMIKDNGLQNHFGQYPTFYCQEFNYNNNYYLIAILTRP